MIASSSETKELQAAADVFDHQLDEIERLLAMLDVVLDTEPLDIAAGDAIITFLGMVWSSLPGPRRLH